MHCRPPPSRSMQLFAQQVTGWQLQMVPLYSIGFTGKQRRARAAGAYFCTNRPSRKKSYTNHSAFIFSLQVQSRKKYCKKRLKRCECNLIYTLLMKTFTFPCLSEYFTPRNHNYLLLFVVEWIIIIMMLYTTNKTTLW